MPVASSIVGNTIVSLTNESLSFGMTFNESSFTAARSLLRRSILTPGYIYISGKAGLTIKEHCLSPNNHRGKVVSIQAHTYF